MMSTELIFPDVTVTAAGPISTTIVAIRESVADSSNFQSAVEASSKAEALNSVWGSLGPEDSESDEISADVLIAMRPRMSIFLSPNGLILNRNAQQTFTPTSTYRLRYEENFPEEFAGNPLDLELDFYNRVGQIMADIKNNANKSPYPDTQSVTLETPVMRSTEQEISRMGDFLYCYLSLTIGNRG